MSDAEGRTGLTTRERLDRRRARSWTLQVLYRWESEGSRRPIEAVFSDILRTRRVSPRRTGLVEGHVERIERHLAEVDEILGESMENWRLERLSRIDRSVLRLAASEILFEPDMPPKIALQEGIRLAGQYGGDQSPRFVNGVLDAVLRRSGRED